ncbi:hypothetical protein EUBIFOR_00769 [Holdemanella biformis DSM 3989]|uniref:Uncharacterized protein n=1 Tax=Holdemanella biformis DSM 3989 TaxID=518637 RepID=B7C9B2_9FIRM|nr:hypothetical protein EUBIFOR_00769 [Holdemanella biformis DSM 3989]
MIDKTQLKMDTGIKVIEEIAPVFKDCIFVLVLSQLIVDVIEADTLRIRFSLYPADSISSHFLISDRLLDGQFFLPAFLFLLFFFSFLSTLLYPVSATVFLFFFFRNRFSSFRFSCIRRLSDLFRICLIIVFSFIFSDGWTKKLHPDHMHQNIFQMHPVFFVHGK